MCVFVVWQLWACAAAPALAEGGGPEGLGSSSPDRSVRGAQSFGG